MYKNWRVGQIKYVPPLRKGKFNWVLVDVFEWCESRDGKPYVNMPRYNIWVYFDTTKFHITQHNKGNWMEFGFYIQAFRNNNLAEEYDNVLTMKHTNIISESEAVKSAQRIYKSISQNNLKPN